MQVAEIKNEKTEFHAKVTIPAKDISNKIELELTSIAKTAKMDGFRVGKVPMSMLRRKYGNSIRADIVKERIRSAVNEVISKNKLHIALEPVIDGVKNEDNADLEFTLKCDLLPEVALPDFKKISIQRPKLELSEQDVNHQLNNMAESASIFDKESKGKSAKGDQLVIDATGYTDGKAFDGGKLEGHKLVLGSNAFIPGFEDQLVGVKAGSDVHVQVIFPAEYHAKELAGKDAKFEVYVKAVYKPTKPKIDDELAKKMGCKTVKELTERIKDHLTSTYDTRVYMMMKMKLFDKLNDTLKFDIPKSLIQREIDVIQKQSDQLMDSEFSGKTDKEKKTYIEKLAVRRVRIGLVIAEYVKKENIDVTENDLNQAVINTAREYPGQEQKVIEFYQKNRQPLEALKGSILEDKGVKEIFDKEVVITDKTYSKDELDQLLAQE